MKKVVDFLEKYVQWLAVALGALFVLAMAWQYIVGSPVTVTVGAEKLGPGDIDKYIYEHPVQTLEAQMHNGPGELRLPTPNWLDQFKRAMDFSDHKPVVLARPWVDAPVLPIGPGGGDSGSNPSGIAKVEAVPTVPVAIMGGATMGASNVVPPGGSGSGEDKNWVAIAYQIPNKEQAAQFAAIKLPKALYPIAVFEATLYRQQQLSNGNWDTEVPIRRLSFEQMMPMPKAGAKIDQQLLNQQNAFLAWAGSHQKEIIQPEFYTVLRGDPFAIPPLAPVKVEAPPPTVALGLPNFDPNRWQYTLEERKQMTPEQRKQADEAYKKHLEDEKNKNKGKQRPRGGPGGGKGGAGASGAHAPQDDDRPDDSPSDEVTNPYDSLVMYLQIPPNNNDRRGDRDEPAPPAAGQQPAGQQPAGQQPGNPTGAADPNAAPMDAHPCPTGVYDPATSPDHWYGWAIDETVEPGKVYRYRVVYTIKNPLWRKPNNVAKKELAEIFSLSSDKEKTGWSDGFKVPSRTSFYISRTFNDKSDSIAFEVFAFQGGVKRPHTFMVSPGDMIGAPADGVDYATGSTLVDIVTDARGRAYAIIADAAGNMVRRNFDTDKTNPDYDTDKRNAANPPAAAAPASPSPVASER